MCLKTEVCEGKGLIRGLDALRLSVIDEIGRGIELIRSIDDFSFRKQANGTASVGEQFRHNLDFLNVFLKGVQVGRIDYENREREDRVSKDRHYAVERFERAITGFENLRRSDLEAIISVASEVDRSVWLMSSVSRELEFVYSHTVHHHALIGEKLAGFGLSIHKDFGVSRSTLTYWQQAA